jgi:hypothetical protein
MITTKVKADWRSSRNKTSTASGEARDGEAASPVPRTAQAARSPLRRGVDRRLDDHLRGRLRVAVPGCCEDLRRPGPAQSKQLLERRTAEVRVDDDRGLTRLREGAAEPAVTRALRLSAKALVTSSILCAGAAAAPRRSRRVRRSSPLATAAVLPRPPSGICVRIGMGQALEVAKPATRGDPLPAECDENADEEGRYEGECRVSHRTRRSRLGRRLTLSGGAARSPRWQR